jgi:thiol-disulfide isomerase/thioredoxin/uncharacterized membrane protein YphA (DoxX/SURF4 family)
LDTLIVLLQLVLAGVLIAAAVGKLRDLPGSREAMKSFGVPEQYAHIGGTALPVVELVLGLGLLWGVTARWAALLAALLFIAFIVTIGYNLSKGRQPDCHCFGQIHSEPAGWPTLIRNGVLTLAAVAIVGQGAVGPVDWFDSLSRDGEAQTLIGLGILTVLAMINLYLRKLVTLNTDIVDLQADLANRLELLAEGQLAVQGEGAAATEVAAPVVVEEPVRKAPDFDLPGLDGERMTLASIQVPGKQTFLMFADPGCGPCKALTPDIAEWQQRFGEELPIAVISRGTEEANRQKFVALGVKNIGLQEDWEVYKEYEVRGTPSAVLIDADGIIRQPYATGRDSIRDLVSRTFSKDQPAPGNGNGSLIPGSDDPNDIAHLLRKAEGPEVGSSASRVPLPTTEGGFVGLDDFLGEPAVVVFWNVGCGFCQRMIPDLKEIEEEAGDKLSRVLIVSRGDIQANREQGLKSKMVIDDGFTMGKAFGANGTPSAIKLDAEGKVASQLAIGADPVLSLLEEVLELDPVKAE